jgi:hypothetical protein
MSDGPDLTFDADGFVRMDALPDVDPDVAVAPDELARLQSALRDGAVPSNVGADWDAMVADVDRIDFGDSLALVPDDGVDVDGDGPPGPIVLVEDEPATSREPLDFEPEAIGRPADSSAGGDRSASTDSAATTRETPGWDPDPDALDVSDSSWGADDPFTIPDTDDRAPDLGEIDQTDDLLDVDVVELHHDDGDLPGTSH